MFDCIIIGAGPAGISASLYTQRANLKTVVLGSESNALKRAHIIDNYYGTPGVSGKKLQKTGMMQAEKLGVEILNGEVLNIAVSDDFFIIKTTFDELTAKTVILATGGVRKTPVIKGLSDFEGKGVSYCAVCDGFFFKKRKVCVLGSGSYALHEAEELKNIGCDVTILTNGKPIEEPLKVFEYNEKKISALKGKESLEEVVFTDGIKLQTSGFFVAEGTADAGDLARKIGLSVQGSSIEVDASMATNIPGIYACGDCTGAPYQISKAVYEGMKAGMSAIAFLRDKKAQK